AGVAWGRRGGAVGDGDRRLKKDINDALDQASGSDLLNEVLRLGMTVKAWQWPAPGPGNETMTDGTMKYWETVRGRELQSKCYLICCAGNGSRKCGIQTYSADPTKAGKRYWLHLISSQAT